MLWGHLAVALFIVVSGFSLTLAPLRNGDRLPGGFSTYIRRRAFRILPPYWVALVVSCLVIETFTGRFTGQVVTVKSIVVHSLLLQDVIGSPSPNGAFWSVAVEWQIYFLFPLLLLLWRQIGGPAMVVLTTIIVVASYLAGTNFRSFEKILHLTPQFLALFAFGVAAAHVLVIKGRFYAVPWTSIGLALTGTTVLVLYWWEPEQVEAHFFWVDLLAGVATATLFAGCAQHPEGRVARLLSTRFARWLGQSSYSLYLIHLPVLGLVYWGLVVRLSDHNDTRFLLLLVLGTPTAVLVSRLFWRVFERPFMKHRSFQDLARAWRSRRTRE
jgi:peptidoglycan/LPS O-acetylase OafA/YrhL